MGVRVLSWHERTLCITAPLRDNRNIHGTGFAGSQYALAAICGWGALTLRLAELAIDASILTTGGTIRFDVPARADLVAICDLGPHEALFERLRAEGQVTFPLACEVGEHTGAMCTYYTGHYPVRTAR